LTIELTIVSANRCISAVQCSVMSEKRQSKSLLPCGVHTESVIAIVISIWFSNCYFFYLFFVIKVINMLIYR